MRSSGQPHFDVDPPRQTTGPMQPGTSSSLDTHLGCPSPDAPRRYKLPPARPSQKESTSHARESLSFQLRSRTVQVASCLPSSDYPHVRHATVQPCKMGLRMVSLARLLPVPLADWLKFHFSEWFLPADLILKSEKPGHAELFDTEVVTYERLRPLQGVVVPQCFGVTRIIGSDAGARMLVLHDVSGVALTEPAGATLQLPTLSDMLQSCQLQLRSRGVHQEDPELGNFRLVNDGRSLKPRLMALDFEFVTSSLSTTNEPFYLQTNTEFVLKKYRQRQLEHWKAGRIVEA